MNHSSLCQQPNALKVARHSQDKIGSQDTQGCTAHFPSFATTEEIVRRFQRIMVLAHPFVKPELHQGQDACVQGTGSTKTRTPSLPSNPPSSPNSTHGRWKEMMRFLAAKVQSHPGTERFHLYN